jgi:hypothetical protein
MLESEPQERLACLSIEQLLTQVQNEISRYQHQQSTAHRYSEERLALRCLFGYKPAEIHQHYPTVFPTVQDVYRVKRNLLERLRRNRALRAYLRERNEVCQEDRL